MPRSFALGEQLEAFIDEQVRSGRYSNASEVVREGLNLMKDFSTARLERAAELTQMVEEARRDTTLVDGMQLLARLEDKYRKAESSAKE